ncbi:SCO family protein [Reinekea thalattae]|uniref:SCO family protein n=1 Tax=Reinekea thalattae TaxID=2593301 RepID=A0A5C8ZAD2_9GAMM|nr:SCO family protein [Reinekea thalattae]TXR54737.1 SCO family protein [Reinekea thalattae]
MTNRVQFTVIAAVLITVIAAYIGFSHYTGFDRQLKDNHVLRFPSPRLLPEVSLTRHDGEPFSIEQFKGRWNLINFGYTFCPDICPTNMADMRLAYTELAEAGFTDQLNFWMVTVDPARDTEQQLALYVPYFHADFVGLTGSSDEISQLASALDAVYYIEGEGEGYTVAHSDNYAIINPAGEYVALIRPPHRAQNIVAALKVLMQP